MRPLLILAAIVYLPVVGSTAVLDDKDDFSCAASQFGNLPLYFIENQGQIESNDVAFYVTGSDKTLYFTPEGITFALKGDGNERWTVKLSFVGAQPVKPVGRDKQKAVLSYFRGRSENWKTGISTYGELVYEDLWPGIDLVYYGSVNKLKYEFIVEPGADPGMIRLEYCGLSDLNITEAGALKVTTPVGSFVDDVPFAYQLLGGETEEVAMRYVLEEKVDIDRLSFTFDLGDYDPSEPLILDPAMLVYCGFIGGSDWDVCHDIAVDMDGNAYVVGIARSMQNSFPVKTGPDLTHNSPGADDIFVAKINAQGTEFFYCGYIGGTSWDTSEGIAIDSQGCAYVTGCTKSDQSSFPVTVGPDLTHNGGADAFVAKINPSGTALDYCGYIGGSGLADICNDIEVDAQGNAYVTGWTNSGQSTFPVTVGPDLTHNGGGFYGGDGFVAKVNDQGTALVYCGYIGGDNEERCGGITIDDDGNAYVTGWTESDQPSFPVAVGPDLTHNGNRDAFVAKINAQGTQLLYCGYIGGSLEDSASAIVVDLVSCPRNK